MLKFATLICTCKSQKCGNMSQKSYVKCLECNALNLNRDYCKDCGAIINIRLKRQLESEKKIAEELEEEIEKGPSRIDKFLRSATEHPNKIVRGFSHFIYAIWIFLGMVIGALIAGFISIVTG